MRKTVKVSAATRETEREKTKKRGKKRDYKNETEAQIEHASACHIL